MLTKIAVLGSNGFVGSRLLEIYHLGQIATIIPIVRNYSSLACQARFDLDWRVADACDEAALSSAMAGCDAVVNLIAADPSVILKNASVSYRAAQAAGVKRMVFMSSASVHGQAPAAQTDEASKLHTNHPFAYNNAKVKAERSLCNLRERGSVELVILRPSIVYGPRSRWISDIADQLLADSAYLINDGLGICNSIYVDNLIHAITLALNVQEADREIFLVGDDERVTWLEFYRHIAVGLGLDISSVAKISSPIFEHGLKDRLSEAWGSRIVQSILPVVPTIFKDVAKGAIKAATAPPTPPAWLKPVPAEIQVTEEYSALHKCSVHLPRSKAHRILGYQSPISFAEGMHRSLGWLHFSGYPVKL